MNGKKKKIIAAIVTVALIIISYFTYESVMYADTDNAQVEARTVMLASKVSGFVQEVNVTEGQKVKKGDVLVVLDSRDFQNTLTQIRADYQSSLAKKNEAEKNHLRLSSLYKSEAISQQQYDQANSLYNDLRAKSESLAAQVAQAELNLSNTKIIAPNDGFIAKKSVEVGQLAAPGVPLIGFVDSTERWVVANYKETDVEHIKVGAAAHIKVDAIGSKKFEGIVEALSSATGATFSLLPPDNATGNFTKVVQRIPVRIKFNNLSPDDIDLLRAGLSAEVKINKK